METGDDATDTKEKVDFNPVESVKEKEPKPSLLTWKSAAIVLASVGAGYFLGSRETRRKIGKEISLRYRGFRNALERGQSVEERFRFRRLIRQVFPEDLRMEK